MEEPGRKLSTDEWPTAIGESVGNFLGSLKMPKPRPLRVRITEATDKLERLRDLERMEKIKQRMLERKKPARSRR